VRGFDFDKSPAALVKFEKDQDAGSADLNAFQKHGAKLILYNGWADHSTPPLRSVAYFEQLREKTPGRDEFVRLFMMPGLYHCNGGPGPNVFGGLGQRGYKLNDPEGDIIAALDQWVEKGIAPSRLLTIKFANDNPIRGVARTRPVCPYPQMATYKRSGSIDDAANFTCAMPKPQS
jgi:feruloyl esterase